MFGFHCLLLGSTGALGKCQGAGEFWKKLLLELFISLEENSLWTFRSGFYVIVVQECHNPANLLSDNYINCFPANCRKIPRIAPGSLLKSRNYVNDLTNCIFIHTKVYLVHYLRLPFGVKMLRENLQFACAPPLFLWRQAIIFAGEHVPTPPKNVHIQAT